MSPERNVPFFKKTCLEGFYKTLTRPDISGKILITEISAGGCHFSTFASHPFRPDDRLGIAFSLNDPRNSMVRKEAIVRSVDGRDIDCQFVILPGHYDPALGFYMRTP